MLTIYDKGGRGGKANADMADKGGFGVWLMLKAVKKCLKIAKKYKFLSNSSGHINFFFSNKLLSSKIRYVIQEKKKWH